jgi:hypothetical protein
VSSTRRTLLVAFIAVLGIALAAVITWGTSQLVRQRIGLASEPLTAGRRLLPAPAGTKARHTTTTTKRVTRSTTVREPSSRTQTGQTPSPATSSTPTQTGAGSSGTPRSASPPEGGSGESSPSSSNGSSGDGRDSSSRRDD